MVANWKETIPNLLGGEYLGMQMFNDDNYFKLCTISTYLLPHTSFWLYFTVLHTILFPSHCSESETSSWETSKQVSNIFPCTCFPKSARTLLMFPSRIIHGFHLSLYTFTWLFILNYSNPIQTPNFWSCLMVPLQKAFHGLRVWNPVLGLICGSNEDE